MLHKEMIAKSWMSSRRSTRTRMSQEKRSLNALGSLPPSGWSILPSTLDSTFSRLARSSWWMWASRRSFSWSISSSSTLTSQRKTLPFRAQLAIRILRRLWSPWSTLSGGWSPLTSSCIVPLARWRSFSTLFGTSPIRQRTASFTKNAR